MTSTIKEDINDDIDIKHYLSTFCTSKCSPELARFITMSLLVYKSITMTTIRCSKRNYYTKSTLLILAVIRLGCYSMAAFQ